MHSFQYRKADAFLRDFEIMKANAIKFNGPTNGIALEAIAIYDFVKNQIESIRGELTALEEEVEEIMSGKAASKKVKSGKSKKTSSVGTTRNVAHIGGMAVELGDISQLGEGSDYSDSEDSFELADNL
jgi:transcription initiation factor TFIID subunit 1